MTATYITTYKTIRSRSRTGVSETPNDENMSRIIFGTFSYTNEYKLDTVLTSTAFALVA